MWLVVPHDPAGLTPQTGPSCGPSSTSPPALSCS